MELDAFKEEIKPILEQVKERLALFEPSEVYKVWFHHYIVGDNSEVDRFDEVTIQEIIQNQLLLLGFISSKYNISLNSAATAAVEKWKGLLKSKNSYVIENNYYDKNLDIKEQLPRFFTAELAINNNGKSILKINSEAIGNQLTNNSYIDDGYKFHDVFHLYFMVYLRWSPVLRKLLDKKRKSNDIVDEIEDGARAEIIEESLVSLIYNNAKINGFYENKNIVDFTLLKYICEIVSVLEIKNIPLLVWNDVIIESSKLFNNTVKNNGAIFNCNLEHRTITI